MKVEARLGRMIPFFLVVLFSQMFPVFSYGATMNDYCIVPPYISQNVLPNLLLMIDNSSSMYDLSYSDQGNMNSTGTITRQPYYCFDETYSSANTYAGYFDSGSYYYYDSTNNYFYATATFPASSNCQKMIANTLCVGINSNKVNFFAASGNYLNWLAASKFDIEKQVLTGGKVVSNLCSGTDQSCNSNSDCTSGTCTAVATSFLQGESRGCVGQGFIKTALTSDFANFTTTDSNTPLGITFAVRGPVDSTNPANPSRGGQTYIDVYNGTYNNQACQTAINDYYNTSINQTTLSNAIQACINYNPNPGNKNYCSQDSSRTYVSTCTTDSDCNYPTSAGSQGTCATVGGSCWSSSDCPVQSTTPGTCTNTNNSGGAISCTSNTSCLTGAIATGKCSNDSASCSSSADCAVQTQGKCAAQHKSGNTWSYAACSSDSDCVITNGSSAGNYGPCNNPAPTHYPCNNPLPNPSTSGTCANVVQVRYACNGAVSAGSPIYVGPCVNPTQSGVVKTKIALSETIQTCWTYLSKGQAIGTGDYNRLISGNGKCDDVYAAYGVCSLNNLYGCSTDADCSANSAGTCSFSGPAAILPGNPAEVCDNYYLGQFCTWNATTKKCTWNIPSPDSPVVTAYENFCNAQQPTVIDPTDSAASSSNYEQLPALLGGTGLEGQLGVPIGSIPVRVKLNTGSACTTNADCSTDLGYSCINGSCDKTGLIQQYASRIRPGAMSFNFNGSATEASSTTGAAIPVPRVCSNNTTRLCSINLDCPGGTCLSQANSASYNYDGGQVIYPIGLGVCVTMTPQSCTANANCSGGNSCINGFCGTKNTTVCTIDSNCTSGDTCISNGVGNHTAGLVNTIDSIRANAWTPLAEAFYNAIGYFARLTTGNSRTDLRLNSVRTSSTDFSSISTAPMDFNAALNPSQYRCQMNYTLLITDGSSTMDQNANVSTLAGKYSAAALSAAGYSTAPASWNSTCSYLAGSTYLPILSWMAKKLNIGTFSTSTADLTQTPVNNRDSITTFVVANGGSNGLTGECNAINLLADTAKNGGTQLYLANDPTSLKTSLTNVFDQVAAKTSSGTAASVLSNSEGSGANILQAVFYPRKIFDNDTQAHWLGELNSLWYYVDPFINNSTVREDTAYTSGINHYLYLTQNNIATFSFDTAVHVTLNRDANGDGVADPVQPTGFPVVESPDSLKSIWKAGKQLWARDISATGSPRTIYTPCFNSGTCAGTTGLMNFSWGTTDNSAALQTSLQYPSDNASAVKLMKWVSGFDFPGDDTMRSRTVQIGSIPSTYQTDTAYISNPRDKGIGVWKLGDIISSTPRLQSSLKQNAYNLIYGDSSYDLFVKSTEYAARGVAYAGANDGMLHAFTLGTLSIPPVAGDPLCSGGDCKARLSGAGLGAEQWAFIPQNALPYLKYLADPSYDSSHIYSVDGVISINDASIDKAGCSAANYWNCPKQTTYTTSTGTSLDIPNTSWRSILLGGMGIGGASGSGVSIPITGGGYSSYFALDVTSPGSPKFLWEFTNAQLGFATSGPAIVRINAQTNGARDISKNGRWFAIFASGPTGPIDTSLHAFKATSTQTLKLFVVDLATGSLVATFDSLIPNAFAATISKGVIDTDRWNSNAAGYYQDDAVYIGYVKKATDGTWTDGGILRLVIKESYDPDSAPTSTTWIVNTLIDGIGPVTTNVTKLQDRKNHNLWIYFGTGRYSYGQDDMASQRHLFGIKEPCYSPSDDIDITIPGCTTLYFSDLQNTDSLFTGGSHGWYIPLDAQDTTNNLGAERSVTDPVAMQNGTVFFTTFKPTSDICNFGGNSYMWGVKYDTGGQIGCPDIGGKALVQQSTGSFQEVDLGTAFGTSCPLPAGESWPANQPPPGDAGYRGGRRMANAMTGKPPQDPPPIISNAGLVPVKKVLHVQEH